VGVDKHIIIFPKTWQTIIHNLHPEFLLPFWKQWEDSDVMLASTQETLLIKKVNRIYYKLKWLMHHQVEQWSHIALQERVTVKRGAPSPGNTKPPSTALMSYKVTHRPKSFSTCFPTPKPLQKPQSSFNITKTYAPIASKGLDRKTLNKSRWTTTHNNCF
jgi:hypothetical protein